MTSSGHEISAVLSSLAAAALAVSDGSYLTEDGKYPEDSSTNILEALFDYTSHQRNFEKLVKMGHDGSKATAATNNPQQSTSQAEGSSQGSIVDMNYSSKSVLSNCTEGSLQSTAGSISNHPSLKQNGMDDSVSQYTEDEDDTHVTSPDGNVRYKPHPVTESKSKTRWYSCCQKKKRQLSQEEKTEILRCYNQVPPSSTRHNSVPQDINNSIYESSSLVPSPDPQIGNYNLAPTDSSAPKDLVSSPGQGEGSGQGKGQVRRIRIPDRPDVSMSLWGVIKNAMGKDLTKLPLPVNFNEPLSMLQRLAEDYEYSSVLDRAAMAKDSYEQMTYVAAFTVSSYACTAVRTGKPFNPLLGETFECDRMDDLGWRCLCEQVCHHPPTAAQHCSGKNWICWQEFTMSSRFRGNYIEVTPLGIAHLVFTDSGNHYTWRKVSSIVHNLILGKLWVDQQGEMDIFNYTTGDNCHLTYVPSNSFRGESKRVEGRIVNKELQPKFTLAGYWDKKMESFEVLRVEEKDQLILGPATLLWSRNLPSPESDKYYNFTLLACQLNEMDESVAPTDSRRRTDQRLMEFGLYDEANTEKLRLEEKQRVARNTRNVKSVKSVNLTESATSNIQGVEGGPGFQATWFSLQKDATTQKLIHMFKGDYWDCKAKGDWSRCPDIYGP